MSVKVGKSQLVTLVAERMDVTKVDTELAIDTMLTVISEQLQQGNEVSLPGLGKLLVTPTKERSGVRPGTTERITIPAGQKISFRASSTLKNALTSS
ncbi:HU family DNA-binding protein [Deinococcus roseus]|uniref:DNA-binding protein HU n=1 Tax=Deinococcus roseus TaxID=392414 RepID=A0ABQ2D7B9_9DEIO|nr:HU family DNA-binding protein [Deinococcus roseus]GGJ44203.1 DNA-binding protein HU [Deinococcus roseus]